MRTALANEATIRRPPCRTILRIGIVAAGSAMVLLVVWTLLAVRASPEAHAALISDAAVTVVPTDTHVTFSPARNGSTTGLLFFAGALVDPVSYAPILRQAAEAGYAGILVRLPNRGILGGVGGPEVLARGMSKIAELRGIERWVVAAHSRGGAAAVRLAQTNAEAISALVLIGSSDPRDFSLAGTSLPVTQIYGSLDTVEDEERIQAALANLPTSTRRIRIEGGNHSQFAYYGLQPGDWPATITRQEQQRVMMRTLLDVLSRANR